MLEYDPRPLKDAYNVDKILWVSYLCIDRFIFEKWHESVDIEFFILLFRIHHNYGPESKTPDLALAQVSRRILFRQGTISPICLPNKDIKDIPVGDNSDIKGYVAGHVQQQTNLSHRTNVIFPPFVFNIWCLYQTYFDFWMQLTRLGTYNDSRKIWKEFVLHKWIRARSSYLM